MTSPAYRDNFGLIDWSDWSGINARTVKEPDQSKRSDLGCPMVISDAIAPTRSMATGEVMDSKSALRRSHRADGNPQGRAYVEYGDATPAPAARQRADAKSIRDTVERAAARIDAGDIPAHIRDIQ